MTALTSPGLSSAARARGLKVEPGVDCRGCVMCEPATVGAASAARCVSEVHYPMRHAAPVSPVPGSEQTR